MGHSLLATYGGAQFFLLGLQIWGLYGKHVIEHVGRIELTVGLGFFDSPPHFGVKGLLAGRAVALPGTDLSGLIVEPTLD